MRHGLLAILLFPGLTGPALADTDLMNLATPAGWAWAQIRQGKVADFRQRCSTSDLSPAAAPCQEMPPELIERFATDPDLSKQIPHQGIRLAGVIITGDLDLSNALVASRLSIASSALRGSVDLSHSHFTISFELPQTQVAGEIRASGAVIERNLVLSEAVVSGVVNLIGANVDGFANLNQLSAANLVMDGAHFGHDVIVDQFRLIPSAATCEDGFNICGHAMTVAGQLNTNALSGNARVYLGDAQIHGDYWFGGQMGELFADSVHVQGTIHGGDQTSDFGTINLTAADIGTDLALTAQKLARLDAPFAHIGGRAEITFGIGRNVIDLSGAHVDGNLTISRGGQDPAAATLDAPFLRVDGSLRLVGRDDPKLVDWGAVTLGHGHVGESLTVAATLRTLDLSDTVVGAELHLGENGHHLAWAEPNQPERQRNAPILDLRNAHAGEVLGGFDAWPRPTGLADFSYRRVQLFDGDKAPGEQQMFDARRTWLALDRYSPQHYAQLASSLAAQGDRDGAADIQLLAREQETREAWHNADYFRAALLSALWAVAGFGIGDYTWRVVYWIALLTLVGSIAVAHARWPTQTPPRSVFGAGAWAVGASLENLLPFVKLDRRFSDFFEKQEGFLLWHRMVFTALALTGSILGLFLAAAASGLTQHG